MRDSKFMRLVLALSLSVASTFAGCASSTGSAPQNGSGGVAAAASGGGGGSVTAPAGSGGAGVGSGGSSAGGAGPAGTGGGTPTGTGGAVASGGSSGSPGSSGGGSAGAAGPDGAPAAETNPTPPAEGGKVLIFTNSTGYRHVSIEAEAAAIKLALEGQGFKPEVSADPARFTSAALAGVRGIVLISTTGKPLGDPGTEALAALDAFVQGGGGLVGVHAASSTFYEPEGGVYTRLIGGKFVNHPGSVRKATCYPEGTHVSAAKLPASFSTEDEIYVFSNYRTDNQVVLRCAAFTGNEKLPIAWFRSEGKGRVFNSALGHNATDFAPTALLMRDHFLPGILWALGR